MRLASRVALGLIAVMAMAPLLWTNGGAQSQSMSPGFPDLSTLGNFQKLASWKDARKRSLKPGLTAYLMPIEGRPLTAALNSAQVVPLGDSTARGHCKIIGNHDSWFGPAFSIQCDFSGLTGALVDADIRTGHVGENGDGSCGQKEVWVTLPNAGSGRLSITCENNWMGASPWVADKDYYLVLQTEQYPDGEIRGQIKPVTLDSDFNGDGRAEVAIFRPSDSTFYGFCDLTQHPVTTPLTWEETDDSPAFLADFDGDGISDVSFVRTDHQSEIGRTSVVIRRSSDSKTQILPWGSETLGDLFAWGDYNGDGAIDTAVYRKPTGVWYILERSDDVYSVRYEWWGQPNTDFPCPGDYDGDGKTDLCVVRPENGHLIWYIHRSSDNGERVISWGLDTDGRYTTSNVDVDADGMTDPLVSRNENVQRYFYALKSSDGSEFVLPWGLANDEVKIGDFDGDGKTDFAAVREVDGHLIWMINQSSGGERIAYWGLPGDK